MLQRFDGVFGGSLDGWVNTEDDPNHKSSQKYREDDLPASVWIKWGDN